MLQRNSPKARTLGAKVASLLKKRLDAAAGDYTEAHAGGVQA